MVGIRPHAGYSENDFCWTINHVLEMKNQEKKRR